MKYIADSDTKAQKRHVFKEEIGGVAAHFAVGQSTCGTVNSEHREDSQQKDDEPDGGVSFEVP